MQQNLKKSFSQTIKKIDGITTNNFIEREYDIILYGSTSFTAKYVIAQLKNCDLKIALAARNTSKITKTQFDVIESDISAIESVTQKTKVFINLVGPYSKNETGLKIIEACIKTSTDYVDITGEVNFIKEAYKKYNSSAKYNQVSIVQSCGFDSVPSDIGAFYLAKCFDECSIRGQITNAKTTLNTGTWDSFIESMISFCKKKNEQSKQKVKKDKTLIDSKSCSVRYLGPDCFIANKSAQFLKNIATYKYEMFMKMKNRFFAYLFLFYMFFISKMVKYSFFGSLLKKFPCLFSFGMVRSGGPSENQVEKGFFEIEMVAHGKHREIEKTKKLLITGKDPSYLCTSIFVTECAYQLVRNRNAVPKGVITPAIAFHNTDIVECFIRKGVSFKLVDL